MRNAYCACRPTCAECDHDAHPQQPCACGCDVLDNLTTPETEFIETGAPSLLEPACGIWQCTTCKGEVLAEPEWQKVGA